MTITGSVHRFARLRSGAHIATVTRISAESGPVWLVETHDADGPTFTPCPTWRTALAIAADAITTAATRPVRVWS